MSSGIGLKFLNKIKNEKATAAQRAFPFGKRFRHGIRRYFISDQFLCACAARSSSFFIQGSSVFIFLSFITPLKKRYNSPSRNLKVSGSAGTFLFLAPTA